MDKPNYWESPKWLQQNAQVEIVRNAITFNPNFVTKECISNFYLTNISNTRTQLHYYFVIDFKSGYTYNGNTRYESIEHTASLVY